MSHPLPVPRRALLAAPFLLPAAAHAVDAYPTGPVTLVVPFAVGGATHFVAQILARRLAAILGQPFRIEVITGESGLAAMADVARAAPDGHRLVLSPNSTFAMAAHYLDTPLVIERDFAPVCLVASTPMVLCVHTGSRFHTLQDLVEAARLAPERLRYGSAGIGVINHLAVELFAKGFDLRFQHITFSGGAPAMHAVLQDQVQFAFIDLVTAIPRIAGGGLRPLAVSSAARAEPLRQVPTIAESGLPGFAVTTDFALFAPARTPELILERLCRTSTAVMRAEATRQILAPLAITPTTVRREGFHDYLKGQDLTWLAAVRWRERHTP
ncbi:tripartite tricarboxylate transporter substrate binding protein [Roseococcus sp. SDR]|uniref:tripartite tricarboxylate transporter substrate binding protein n=1 Tax=Roseococcus sp. SDR TaxID=2835532 RepID=UPI001BCB7FBB|nr:tripartite tricarboxylate transporter substrate binding protein [Roseococcus sp. SDR]MBS7791381.1 tripartite tricarboxylate transporter substrate binding protein [Roseococcus sp. SDR]MBV1846695.1 tripartite tricarboxylate transporter substrate binding protein [Roseococcus sp. SDR]